MIDRAVVDVLDSVGRALWVPVDLRAASEGEGDVLEGYAAVFNEWTRIGDEAFGFDESIAPGAFAESIKDDDIRAFFNHNEDNVLGRKKAKTAEFHEDSKGLRVVIRPPNTQAGRDVVELVKRGDVDGMSFMFRIRPNGDEWIDPQKNGDSHKRIIRSVRLFEAGPVTFPAYETTSISARDRAKALFDMGSRQVAEDVLARRREANRLAFELDIAAIEL